MTNYNGFELIREQEIPEINTRARVYRHLKTGAEVLSMENDDENKVFGVAFCTPPDDSTGLPHILEHCVLNGSRKYPVKQPFLELIKGSLQTFVNAMTFSDKTVYPIASQNVQDFYNLADVYLDAVFHPNIRPETLAQEGWHLELEDPDAPLMFKGVVFNEMKGAYSSPESLLGRWSQRSLFPDNTYGNDSGGDPREIPNLTYEQFKHFYDTYYHPANARVWFYGDDDPTERLKLLDDYLSEFEPLDVEADIPVQTSFEQPADVTVPYDAGDQPEGKKGMITVNWVWPEPLDVTMMLACTVLSRILVGDPASPLRKALLDSGLGEDLVGGGLDSWLRQMTFSTGLKGIDPADGDKVVNLIFDTLKELATDGIDRAMTESALNTIEFGLRELNSGPYPRGLLLYFTALSTWLYGGDPLAPLAFEKPLNDLKARLEDEPRFFEHLIQELLLDNTHRSTVRMQPDPKIREQREQEERARLDAIRAEMDEEEVQAVIEQTQKLRIMQQTPDTPEALATIPRLTLDDLEKDIKTVPQAVHQVQDVTTLHHDLFTNGIVYFDLGFDLHALPQDLLPYVPLFGRALLEMGTDREDFVQLLQRIGARTGGISATQLVSDQYLQDGETAMFFLRSKATPAQIDDLLAILQDVLLRANFDNRERFRQIVLESKAGREAGLIPGGHLVTRSRLSAHFSTAGYVTEQMRGVESIFFLRQLNHDIQENWAGVREKLETIRRTLIDRQAAFINVTVDADNWAAFQPKLKDFMGALPSNGFTRHEFKHQVGEKNEGLTIPAQVNYVGKGARLYDLGYDLHGSALAISKYLSLAYLFEHVRVQGGAYGGMCHFDQFSGMFSYLSYRDPNLTRTLNTYNAASDFLRSLKLEQSELTAAIIGAISSLDQYELPDAKGFSSAARYLTGVTDDMRQKFRTEVLNTSLKDFHAFADVLQDVVSRGHVVVLGSKDKIEAVNKQRTEEPLTVRKVL
jgi:hypothetical protein